MEQKEEIKQEKGLVYESMVLKEIKFSPKFPRVWLVGWFCEKERERGGRVGFVSPIICCSDC